MSKKIEDNPTPNRTKEPNAYTREFYKRNYYRPSIYINKEQYPQVVEKLKSVSSMGEYVTSLILADIAKEKD